MLALAFLASSRTLHRSIVRRPQSISYGTIKPVHPPHYHFNGEEDDDDDNFPIWPLIRPVVVDIGKKVATSAAAQGIVAGAQGLYHSIFGQEAESNRFYPYPLYRQNGEEDDDDDNFPIWTIARPVITKIGQEALKSAIAQGIVSGAQGLYRSIYGQEAESNGFFPYPLYRLNGEEDDDDDNFPIWPIIRPAVTTIGKEALKSAAAQGIVEGAKGIYHHFFGQEAESNRFYPYPLYRFNGEEDDDDDNFPIWPLIRPVVSEIGKKAAASAAAQGIVAGAQGLYHSIFGQEAEANMRYPYPMIRPYWAAH